MRKIKIKVLNIEFQVAYSNALYSEHFWDLIEHCDYEPDVLFTLKRKLNSESVFFDVGAADGCMSLIAASLGSKVIAYEPIPRHFNALRKNIIHNDSLVELVNLKQAIVSTDSGYSHLENAQGKYISSIVYNKEDTDNANVEIVNLINEINLYAKTGDTLLKLDIEGAEYKILTDLNLLTTLKRHKVVVILAIHPGFFRPINYSKKSALFGAKKILFILRNFYDNYNLYKKLAIFGQIRRSNEVVVNSPIKFALLAACGVYEYLIHFDNF